MFETSVCETDNFTTTCGITSSFFSVCTVLTASFFRSFAKQYHRTRATSHGPKELHVFRLQKILSIQAKGTNCFRMRLNCSKICCIVLLTSKTGGMIWAAHPISFGLQLNNHMKHHLNLREFQCEICFKAFNEKAEMNRHMKRVHSTGTICGF